MVLVQPALRLQDGHREAGHSGTCASDSAGQDQPELGGPERFLHHEVAGEDQA